MNRKRKKEKVSIMKSVLWTFSWIFRKEETINETFFNQICDEEILQNGLYFLLCDYGFCKPRDFKGYLYRQPLEILTGQVSLQSTVIAKNFKIDTIFSSSYFFEMNKNIYLLFTGINCDVMRKGSNKFWITPRQEDDSIESEVIIN